MKKLAFLILLTLIGLSVNAQTLSDSAWVSPKKELSTFAKIVNTVGQKHIFNGEAITIFAPDNQAFDKLPPRKIDSLLAQASHAELITVIDRHIITGKLTSIDIAKTIHTGNGQAIFTTLAGTTLTAKINANRNIILVDENGNESIIKTFNLNNANAEIFIINSVMLPKK